MKALMSFLIMWFFSAFIVIVVLGESSWDFGRIASHTVGVLLVWLLAEKLLSKEQE